MNKPVAWVDKINTFMLDKDYRQLPESLQNGMTPLYANHVPDGLIDPKSYYQGYEDGKKKSQADIEYESDKAYWRNRTLTDEEIIKTANSLGLIHAYDTDGQWSGITNEPLFDSEKQRNNERLLEILKPFAKAILRKAQEK